VHAVLIAERGARLALISAAVRGRQRQRVMLLVLQAALLLLFLLLARLHLPRHLAADQRIRQT
jgi:hypothetical protein